MLGRVAMFALVVPVACKAQGAQGHASVPAQELPRLVAVADSFMTAILEGRDDDAQRLVVAPDPISAARELLAEHRGVVAKWADSFSVVASNWVSGTSDTAAVEFTVPFRHLPEICYDPGDSDRLLFLFVRREAHWRIVFFSTPPC